MKFLSILLILASTIIGVIWVSIFGVGIYKDIKARRNKEIREYGRWISDCKDYLHRIENEYRDQCKIITEKYFKQYIYATSNGYRVTSVTRLNQIVTEYRNEIDNTKKDFLSNLPQKASEINSKYWHRDRINFANLPNYIIESYEHNISDIADTFYNFYNCMDRYITDVKLSREYETDPKTAREQWDAEYQKELDDLMNQYKEVLK